MGVKKEKGMLSNETIYKIMQWLPPSVTALFFVKNVIAKNVAAMIVIGICLAAFIGILVVAKVKNLSMYAKESALALALPVLVFIISMSSGESFSDDFPMFLAVIALTGMFLEPKLTKIQIVIMDIMFIIMYYTHPEKVESPSQFRLCFIVFTLAAVLFYQVIKRGRAFIEIGNERAAEAEKLLESIRTMGVSLKEELDVSSEQIDLSTGALQDHSVYITKSADNVSDSCSIVNENIKEAKEQIEQLNEQVRHFEDALGENKNNVSTMKNQVESVGEMISESEKVFRDMEEQMNEVVGIANDINDISFKLTLLALNASVESARAGAAGSGFEVLANEMRELSESSAKFSDMVTDVVKELLKRVEKTSMRFSDSEAAMKESEKTMAELTGSFERLSKQFGILYDNIEKQNHSVNCIDDIFGTFNQRVLEMHDSSVTNQQAVAKIVETMNEYRNNVLEMVDNTQGA